MTFQKNLLHLFLDDGSRFLQNADNFLPDCTTLHPGRQKSSLPPRHEDLISHAVMTHRIPWKVEYLQTRWATVIVSALLQVHCRDAAHQVRKAQEQSAGVPYHRVGMGHLRSNRQSHCPGPQQHAKPPPRPLSFLQQWLHHLLLPLVVLHPLYHHGVPLLQHLQGKCLATTFLLGAAPGVNRLFTCCCRTCG